GLNYQSELLSRSYGGNSWFAKFTPAAGKELLSSLPVILRGVLSGKFNLRLALLGHKLAKRDLDGVRTIYDTVEGRPERVELNLYVTGRDEDEPPTDASGAERARAASSDGALADAA